MCFFTFFLKVFAYVFDLYGDYAVLGCELLVAFYFLIFSMFFHVCFMFLSNAIFKKFKRRSGFLVRHGLLRLSIPAPQRSMNDMMNAQ